jgi:integrase
LAGPHV